MPGAETAGSPREGTPKEARLAQGHTPPEEPLPGRWGPRPLARGRALGVTGSAVQSEQTPARAGAGGWGAGEASGPTQASEYCSLFQTRPLPRSPPRPPTAAAGRTWQAGALVRGVPRGPAGAAVLAGGGAAGHVGQLAVRAGVAGAAGAPVGAQLVEAGAAVEAGPGALAALVHVLPAGGPVEAGRAAADVRGLEGQALAAVGAGVGGAGVSLLARLPCGRGGQWSCRPPRTPRRRWPGQTASSPQPSGPRCRTPLSCQQGPRF